MDSEESVYLECACHSLEDTLRVMILDLSAPERPARNKEMEYQLCFDVLMVTGPFWYRLRKALRYLFSGQLYQAETLLNAPEVARLHEVVHEYHRLVEQ